MSGFIPGGFKTKKADPKVIAQVRVELRPDPTGQIKIFVEYPELDPTDPGQCTQIMDMLTSGLQAFIRQWVPKFEKKMITEVQRPEIVLPPGAKVN